MYQPGSTSSGTSTLSGGGQCPPGSFDEAPMAREVGGDLQQESSSGRLRDLTREKLHTVTDRAKNEAGALVQRLKDQGGTALNQQKETAAQGVAGFAQAVHDVADRLHSEGNHNLAGYAEDMCSQIERMGNYLRERDVNGMLSDLGNVIRRKPALFFSGLFITGLAAARFLKASRPAPAEADYEYAGGEPAAGGRYGQETFGDISGGPADIGAAGTAATPSQVGLSPAVNEFEDVFPKAGEETGEPDRNRSQPEF